MSTCYGRQTYSLTFSCGAVLILLAVSVFTQDEIDLDELINGIVANQSGGPTPLTTPDTLDKAGPKLDCPVSTSLCVPFFLCGDGSLAGNQLNLADPTNPCRYDQKCCAFAELHEERITTPLTSDGSLLETTTPRSRPLTLAPNKSNQTGHQRAKCGMRNKDGLVFRISNAQDHETEFGEFPWMVALFEENDVLGLKTNVYRCGGSLIHPQVVLTATHCVNKNRKLVARVGEWDTQYDHEVIPHQDRSVKEVVLHEAFNKGGLFNDIALLILERPVEVSDSVGFVCLPKADAKFDSSQCTASGWGSHKQGGEEQTILKKVDLPVVPQAACQELFRELRKSQSYELHESYLCAGGREGKDTCKGDGGSPLVCPTKVAVEQYVQAGIVSWGRGCGSAQVPGVYANVAVLRDWVDMKMAERNLDKSYYEP